MDKPKARARKVKQICESFKNFISINSYYAVLREASNTCDYVHY